MLVEQKTWNFTYHMDRPPSQSAAVRFDRIIANTVQEAISYLEEYATSKNLVLQITKIESGNLVMLWEETLPREAS